MLTYKQLNEICENLQGTCEDLETAVQAAGLEYDYLTSAEFQEIDSCVVHCECCGWWVDAGEVDENGYCDDCQEENDDE